MVIFRARKKILRALDRAMLAADAWRPQKVAGERAGQVLRRLERSRGRVPKRLRQDLQALDLLHRSS
jgi:hypothetical protein